MAKKNFMLPTNIPLPKGHKLNEYVISQTLGGGGFSMVYLAYDKKGNPLAIKEFFPKVLNLRKEGTRINFINMREKNKFYAGLKDFKDETEIVMKLKHRNIIEIVNFFEENETAYIAMPFEYGYTLSKYITVETDNTEQDIISIIIGIFEAVQMFHENKIIHLDLKPGNIWLRPNKEALVLDFGSARIYDDPEKSKTPPMFTPGYAGPEQQRRYFKPERIGTWTDYYGLGATLYALLDRTSPTDAVKLLMDKESLNEKERKYFERYPLTKAREGQFNKRLLEIADELMTLEWDLRKKIDLPEIIEELKKMKAVSEVPLVTDLFTKDMVFAQNAYIENNKSK